MQWKCVECKVVIEWRYDLVVLLVLVFLLYTSSEELKKWMKMTETAQNRK